MRKILALLFFAAFATQAHAQAQLGIGEVWANATAARAPAKSSTLTSVLDRAFGSTNGGFLQRGASNWALQTTLPAVNGGTGQATYVIGDILFASTTTALSRLADVATGNALISGGVGVAPSWGKITSAHITGQALTKTDDTNVTATLGGTPASALVNASSITLGWTGTLAISRGGTGAGTSQAAINAMHPTPTRAGDITYYNGTNWISLAGNNVGTKVLQEDASGVPSWVSAGTGTVTTLTAGFGLTYSSGATCTTTCTQNVSLTTSSNSLGADVSMNNTANYFDGPSMAQGTTGTWLATGTVTVNDSGGAALVHCKLWDGTTVIASASSVVQSSTTSMSISLSGILAAPAANIRISCKDLTLTTGKILFNTTGNSKDSTITGVRIL